MEYDDKGTYFSRMPWYAVRENYFKAVIKSGGAPVALSYDLDSVDVYLDTIDGLLISGGGFDIHPRHYGEEIKHHAIEVNEARTLFEKTIFEGALKRNMPVLGICGGQQLMNVYFGGSLYQHLPDDFESPIIHTQTTPRTEPGHDVEIIEETLLHKIAEGASKATVNTVHHQAVKRVGNGLIVNAKAPDGLVEGIEHPDYTFCMGVQWHPEFFVSQVDKNIFSTFLACAKE